MGKSHAWPAGLKGEIKMAEQPDELKKLVAVATDLEYPPKVRMETIESIGRIGTHEALLALLDLVANEQSTKGDRELALKNAKKIVSSGH